MQGSCCRALARVRTQHVASLRAPSIELLPDVLRRCMMLNIAIASNCLSRVSSQ